jgi:hypothetical protein
MRSLAGIIKISHALQLLAHFKALAPTYFTGTAALSPLGLGQ